MSTEPVRGPLVALAAELGVATSYRDYLHRSVDVDAGTVLLVLQAMGIAVDDHDSAAAALARIRRERQRRHLPASVVLRAGEQRHIDVGDAERVTLVHEDGTARSLPLDGTSVAVPVLPAGYHRVEVSGADHTSTAHLIVAPPRCPLPLRDRGYGWMVQLYALRSRASWGLGDYRDLATLAAATAADDADMLLVNPLHATAPLLPQQNSPYSPTSRRYRSPLYLRIEDVPELQVLSGPQREEVLALAQRARQGGEDRIDRDAVFTAKTRALETLATVGLSGTARADRFHAWAQLQGQGLVEFATFCALAERHGVPWQSWPAHLRHPGSAEVARARGELRQRVDFHMWLQWLCDEQLQSAQSAATAGGMRVGVVHDLAVGVDPGGADAWALQDDLAAGMTIGAPPDSFNRRGQDWGLPPLLPMRLADTGFAVYRDMLRSVLRHAGGVRIDHIMGLWRLWWVPQDRSPTAGTYVRYPVDDLLAVLALEAERAGAMVIGEDLGTVEHGVRDALADQRVLSSRVLYFERVDDEPEQQLLPAQRYPELALSSVSTHDLPTAAGWWADEEIRVQTELCLFEDSTTPEQQVRRKAGERAEMLGLLRAEGLVDDDPSCEDLVLAMHAFLARTPSLLVAASLGDALGDLRQPNLPGTVDEYPNWRLPLARSHDGTHTPVWLEELLRDEQFGAVTAILRARRGPSGQ